MTRGDGARDAQAARLAEAEANFAEWFERQVNPPHRRGFADDLLEGLEAEAVKATEQRASQAQRNRDRRDAGYGY
jgi:hypothetical protein